MLFSLIYFSNKKKIKIGANYMFNIINKAIVVGIGLCGVNIAIVSILKSKSIGAKNIGLKTRGSSPLTPPFFEITSQS